MSSRNLFVLIVATLLVVATGCSDPSESSDNDDNNDQPEAQTIRVATFNSTLYRDEEGQLVDDLSDPDHEHARQIAEIIQLAEPDVLLVNEFDYDENQQGVELFADNFLSEPQGEGTTLDYPYYHNFESNTGVPSGHDLGDSGSVGEEAGTEEYADDAFGYGKFPGQYAFAVFSKYPLDVDDAREFRTFLWDDMPDNLIPEDFYSDEEIDILRLSSKNHVDLPVDVDGHTLHLLASHPTPPSFDGDEQRNVRRNYDEVRLWHDYIRPDHADYLVDDDGADGGLDEESYFVVAGDLNIDPDRGEETGAVEGLLDDPRTYDPEPTSEGGDHAGPHPAVTADWPDETGNMRVDYTLPSANLTVEDSAVFWPAPDQPHADLVDASDHRLVWVDITLGDE